MNAIITAASVVVIILTVPYLARVIVGPTIFDRILALNALGTKVILLIVMFGLLYGRVDMYVDLALGLILLNLFTTLLIAKFVQQRAKEGP